VTQDLLKIENLKTHFFTSGGVVKAVDGVDLTIKKGESIGLVGESGSGKSVTALSIMRLVPSPPGRILEGSKILFKGENILDKNEDELRTIRGTKIAMSFQDPMTYLNPVLRVGDQIAEAILLHHDVTEREAMRQAIDVMELVQIPDAHARAFEYPHMLSGGMRQRILLSIAISCNPELLIADEPTTALDVIIQSEILELLRHLKKTIGSALLLITHDLGIVAEMSEKVAIMYAGNLMEVGNAKSIFYESKHPYTRGLLNSVPKLDSPKDERLHSIEGIVPAPIEGLLPSGCRFHPRCPYAKKICMEDTPALQKVGQDHVSACLRADELPDL